MTYTGTTTAAASKRNSSGKTVAAGRNGTARS